MSVDSEKQQLQFDTPLDIAKFVAETKTRVKDEINSDFVLAKLPEETRASIIEMTSNAFWARRVVEQAESGVIREELADREKTLERQKYYEEKKRVIREMSKKTFDLYMDKIYITTALYRNIDGNYIIDVITASNKDKDITTEEIKEPIAKKALGKIEKN